MEYDAVVGQYYDRARYYLSNTGRFSSVDPEGYVAGDSNEYRYVNNMPLCSVDPTGTQKVGFGPVEAEYYKELTRLYNEAMLEMNKDNAIIKRQLAQLYAKLKHYQDLADQGYNVLTLKDAPSLQDGQIKYVETQTIAQWSKYAETTMQYFFGMNSYATRMRHYTTVARDFYTQSIITQFETLVHEHTHVYFNTDSSPSNEIISNEFAQFWSQNLLQTQAYKKMQALRKDYIPKIQAERQAAWAAQAQQYRKESAQTMGQSTGR